MMSCPADILLTYDKGEGLRGPDRDRLAREMEETMDWELAHAHDHDENPPYPDDNDPED